MSIVATGSVDGFFLDLVGESLRAKGVEASGEASAYIVGLLGDFCRPDPAHEAAFHRPLAFLLDEALQQQDAGVRFEKLRTLGDGVLYTSGFFADHFEAQGIGQRYAFGIGSRAYGTASSMLRAGSSGSVEEAAARSDVFGELASHFEAFVRVISDVADATLAHGSSGASHLLKLYERWQKTGSMRLAGALGEHGLLPMRAARGVN